MRIGYIYGFRAFPPRGGNQLHAYQLIKCFQDAGHEVLTLGDPTVPGTRSFARDSGGVRQLLDRADVLYVRIDGNPIGKWRSTVSALDGTRPSVWEINAPANERLAFSWLGGRKPLSGPIRRLADRAKRTVHAARQLHVIASEERARARLARNAHAAVCVSSALGRYARERLGFGNVHVIPNGSDPELNHPGRQPVELPARFGSRLKVLYAGSPIYPWQGLDVLTETIRLHERAPRSIAFLLLVNQQTPDLPRGENVHVLESVPYEEVGGYITAADVCVSLHPEFPWSPWGFHHSPMKLFDYMACGRVVLASRVGQLQEVIEHDRNGLLCRNSPAEILESLGYLAGNPSVRHRLGKQARQDVLDQYNWSAIADRTLAILASALEERGHDRG